MRPVRGWRQMYVLDRPRIARPAPKPRTDEEKAQDQKKIDDFIRKQGWNNPATPALGKLVDREARVAVEGDTDANHDNLEDPV